MMGRWAMSQEVRIVRGAHGLHEFEGHQGQRVLRKGGRVFRHLCGQDKLRSEGGHYGAVRVDANASWCYGHRCSTMPLMAYKTSFMVGGSAL